MAKQELFRFRIFGCLLNNVGAFSVRRGRLDRKAIRLAHQILADGAALVIFPEGTRSLTGRMGTAFSGPALIAVRSGAPILPVGISGTEKIKGVSWLLRRPRVTVNIGHPFYLSAVSKKLTKGELSEFTNSMMGHIAELLPRNITGVMGKENQMPLKIEKAAGIGFCFGVKRAISILERVARERGGVETLGAIVHNQPVLQKLAKIGMRVVDCVDDIQGDIVAISSHGVSTQLEEEIKARHIGIINTTCPFVHRAQVAARRLAESGFFTVVYGDAAHPEVKGILGWAKDKGMATLDEKFVAGFGNLPRRLGVLSQTTQIPAHFTEFAKEFIGSALTKDSEVRIIDTICHDIRQRQVVALELASKVDLMLVIGGHNSANTNHLVELCSTTVKTYLVETAEEIQPDWFRGQCHIGITSGASTDEQTINELLVRLEALA